MNLLIRALFVALVAVTLHVSPHSALAQADAGAKARGDYSGTYWSSRSASRSVRHALDYTRGTYEYVQSTPKPSVPYLRADAADVGRNLAAAKAEVAYLKKNSANDKEIAAAVASIEKHLEAAQVEHHKFHAECAKESLDSKVAMNCCSALAEHLAKAHGELEALQKKLAPKPMTPKK